MSIHCTEYFLLILERIKRLERITTYFIHRRDMCMLSQSWDYIKIKTFLIWHMNIPIPSIILIAMLYIHIYIDIL